jgi:hypothetical protein
MSFESLKTLLIVALVGGSIAGCGNYSNEDLEFMAVLPEKADLEAVIPLRSAIVVGDTAELYRLSRSVTLIFNGIVDSFLRLVDEIRANPPTERAPGTRTWGPVPATNQPGWMLEMVMTRLDIATFQYQLQFRRATAADDAAWIPLFVGNYDASGGVRQGMGHVELRTGPLRAAGADPGMGYLDTLAVDYTTNQFPVTVRLEFTNLPNPFKADDPSHGLYTYATQSNGQGALSYDFTGDIIPITSAPDTVEVTSRWLGTGEGRGDLQVVSGDAAGAQETQCWNERFQAVYTYKPWAPLENLGDPSACPAIPTL